ncbi:hypothetical protein D3C86_1090240 [compost metagenome]
MPALARAGLDQDVGVAQLGAGRDVDGRVRLAAQAPDVFKRLVQVALVQFAARPRGQGGAPPADSALALDGRDAAGQIAQRQGARRQRLLGHDDTRGDLAIVDQQVDQVFLQGAQALAAHALADNDRGGAGKRLGRFRAIPNDFPQQEARRFSRKDQTARGVRRWRRQHIGPFGRAGALGVNFLFLTALDFRAAQHGVGHRLRHRRRAARYPPNHHRPPQPPESAHTTGRKRTSATAPPPVDVFGGEFCYAKLYIAIYIGDIFL